MNTGSWDRLDQGQFSVPYGDAASCLQSDHTRHRQSLIFICIIQHHHTHLLVTGTRPPPRGRELGLRYSLA